MFLSILQYLNLANKDSGFAVRIRFAIRTLLLFLVLISYIDISAIDYFISSDALINSATIHWITEHEEFIQSAETLFLHFEFFILILLLISVCKTGIYYIDLLLLFESLLSIQMYFLLFLQLFRNTGILHTGILELIEQYNSTSLSFFKGYVCIVTLSLNIFFLISIIIGYFYRSKR